MQAIGHLHGPACCSPGNGRIGRVQNNRGLNPQGRDVCLNAPDCRPKDSLFHFPRIRRPFDSLKPSFDVLFGVPETLLDKFHICAGAIFCRIKGLDECSKAFKEGDDRSRRSPFWRAVCRDCPCWPGSFHRANLYACMRVQHISSIEQAMKGCTFSKKEEY